MDKQSAQHRTDQIRVLCGRLVAQGVSDEPSATLLAHIWAARVDRIGNTKWETA